MPCPFNGAKVMQTLAVGLRSIVYSYAQITAAVNDCGPARPAIDREAFVAAAHRDAVADLIAEIQADASRADPMPELPYRLFRTYVNDGDRMEYEGRYFARRRNLNSAAIAAILDPHAHNITRLSDILWLICDEYSWAVPAHHRFNTTLGLGGDKCIDLFAAETAHALAEIVTMLGNDLEEPVRERVKENIRRRVLIPFLDEPRSRWWETSTNNWAAVCAGAIGMAGLALEEDPLRLAALIERVQRSMSSFLDGFGTDGGCPEGMDYWVYGYGYFVYYAEALRERTGLDLVRGTEKIAAFPSAVDFGYGQCVSFSDGSSQVVPPTGLMSRLRERLATPMPQITRMSSFDDDHCYRWAHITRTLMWTDSTVIGLPAPAGTSWLPDLAWVIHRSELAAGNPIVFAAKGGHNDEPHNHLDLGTFILSVGGQQILSDLGAGVYDADYFGPNRYNALHNSAAGHSVPVVGGVDQCPGADQRATVAKYATFPGRVRLVLDLSQAYGGTAFRRFFEWHNGNLLTVTDRFRETGQDLVERFISRVRPQVGDNEIRFDGDTATVVMSYDGDWRTEVDEIDTLNHHASPETVYRLRLTGKTAPHCHFEFRVTQLPPQEDA